MDIISMEDINNYMNLLKDFRTNKENDNYSYGDGNPHLDHIIELIGILEDILDGYLDLNETIENGYNTHSLHDTLGTRPFIFLIEQLKHDYLHGYSTPYDIQTESQWIHNELTDYYEGRQ